MRDMLNSGQKKRTLIDADYVKEVNKRLEELFLNPDAHLCDSQTLSKEEEEMRGKLRNQGVVLDDDRRTISEHFAMIVSRVEEYIEFANKFDSAKSEKSMFGDMPHIFGDFKSQCFTITIA